MAKPHPDFPLFPHARGYWAKKIRNKLHYFGKIADDPDGQKALNLWLDQKDHLLAGRVPPVRREGLTLNDLANRFLTAKKHLLESGEITPRTFSESYATCQRLIKFFGGAHLLADFVADDFPTDEFERLRRSLAKRWGPIRLANEIQRIRSVFKYGYDSRLLVRPVQFGPSFKKPTKRVLRVNRTKGGQRMFEAAEIQAILAKSGPTLQAMVLLAINGGLGNADVANLPTSAIDLERGWIHYPRPKTGIDRRIPLWTVTASALREAIKCRPRHKDNEDAGVVFITKYGHRWGRVEAILDPDTGKLVNKQDDAIAKEFKKVITALKIARPGRGFYALRHTFETVGGESRDQVAVNYIMGHAPPDSDMASVYRERISDKRLKAVTDHVHQWLFGADAKTAEPEKTSEGGGTAATGK